MKLPYEQKCNFRPVLIKWRDIRNYWSKFWFYRPNEQQKSGINTSWVRSVIWLLLRLFVCCVLCVVTLIYIDGVVKIGLRSQKKVLKDILKTFSRQPRTTFGTERCYEQNFGLRFVFGETLFYSMQNLVFN